MKEVKIEITGTRPMLMHNGRLANPLDRWVKEIKKYTSKRKKTEDDLLTIMKLEARGGLYEIENKENEDENIIGFPTACVFSSILEAAKSYKLGKSIKKALRYKEINEVLFINGEKRKSKEFLNDSDNIDYRMVRVTQNKILRARPLIKGEWKTTHTFELDEEILDIEELIKILKYAGSYVGLGDNRPTYGTFEVKAV